MGYFQCYLSKRQCPLDREIGIYYVLSCSCVLLKLLIFSLFLVPYFITADASFNFDVMIVELF